MVRVCSIIDLSPTRKRMVYAIQVVIFIGQGLFFMHKSCLKVQSYVTKSFQILISALFDRYSRTANLCQMSNKVTFRYTLWHNFFPNWWGTCAHTPTESNTRVIFRPLFQQQNRSRQLSRVINNSLINRNKARHGLFARMAHSFFFWWRCRHNF